MKRRQSKFLRHLPVWVIGLIAGALLGATITFGAVLATGIDMELAALCGGGLGLAFALLVAGQYVAAEIVLGILEIFLTAVAAILGLVAAVLTAFN